MLRDGCPLRGRRGGIPHRGPRSQRPAFQVQDAGDRDGQPGRRDDLDRACLYRPGQA